MAFPLVRLAALAALPFTLMSGPSANAEEIGLDGCWGVAVVICDPTVHYGVPASLERYTTLVPVCAGSCVYLPVTLYRVGEGEPLGLCVTWDSENTVTMRCDIREES